MPFHSFGPAIRNDYILHVVMEGKGSYHVKNQQFQLKKGDLFLIRPGDSTFYLSDGEDPWMYCWLSFGGHAAKKSSGSRFSEKTSTRWSLPIYKIYRHYLECMKDTEETLENELQLTALTYRFYQSF